MANPTTPITAPVATVVVNGITIGKIKDITASETLSRAEVRGLGSLAADSVPVMSYMGTFSVGAFLVDLSSSGIQSLWNRNVQSVQEFIDSILMNEQGVDIYLYRRIPTTIDPTTQLVTATEQKPIAILRRCFLDSTQFAINDGQIATYNQSGKFLDPIVNVS
jgi:hypothetical protein